MIERKIYKYHLEEGGITVLNLACLQEHLLDIQEQDGTLTLWASIQMCENEEGKIVPGPRKRKFEFFAIGTGWSYTGAKAGEYFKTVQMKNGLVWHIFVKELD